MRAEDALGGTEGHGAKEARTIAPEEGGTNELTEAPATQEMKNEHIAPLIYQVRVELRSTSTFASLTASFSLIGSKGLPTGHVGNGKQHQHGASNGYGHGYYKVLPDCRTCLAAKVQKGLLPTIEAREAGVSCEEAWPGPAATPNATQLQSGTSQPSVIQNQSPPRFA